MKARIILVDDHPMVRQGLCDLIARTADMVVIAQGTDGAAAEHLARTVPADLLVLDIAMPRSNGVDVLLALRKAGIKLPVLFFTMTVASQYAAHVQRGGAQGFIGKEAESGVLLQAMRQILAGGTYFPNLAGHHHDRISPPAEGVLSIREKQVLQGLLRGESQVAIAATLGISAASANTYRRRILEKLGCATNADLIRIKSVSGW